MDLITLVVRNISCWTFGLCCQMVC